MSNYTNTSRMIFKPKLPSNPEALRLLRKRNNPKNKPVGAYTGRCKHCGSKDLWSDNMAYGCNSCDGLLGT